MYYLFPKRYVKLPREYFLNSGKLQKNKIFSKKALQREKNVVYYFTLNANVAHLVERHLAKVEVASSSLVIRSSKAAHFHASFFCLR